MATSSTSDKPHDWIYVASAFMVHFTISLSMKSWGVMFLILLEKFNKSAITTSWPLGIAAMVMGLAGPVVSSLARSYSSRTVTIWGGVMMCGSFIWTALATTIYEVYFSYGLIMGLGASLVYTPTFGIINARFQKRKALALGVSTIGAGLGMFVSPMLLNYLYVCYGYMWTMLLIGAFNLHNVACGLVYGASRSKIPMKTQRGKHISPDERIPKDSYARPDPQQALRNVHDKEDHLYNSEVHQMTKTSSKNQYSTETTVPELTGAGSTEEHYTCTSDRRANSNTCKNRLQESNSVTSKEEGCVAPLKIVQVNETANLNCNRNTNRFVFQRLFPSLCRCSRSVLRNPFVMALVLVNFGYGVSQGVSSGFSAALFCEHGSNTAQASFIYSLSGITDGGIRILLAVSFDIRGVKRYRAYVFDACLIIGCLAVFFMPIFTTYTGFIAMTLVRGIGPGALFSQRATIAADAVQDHHLNDVTGMVLLTYAVGTLMGNAAGGLSRDYLGAYDPAFYGCSIVTFLTAVFLWTTYCWLGPEVAADDENTTEPVVHEIVT